MSAYGHQMEHMYSTRSDSERGSSFVLETGFYITTFAATIFIAGFAAIGLLLITLLVSLTLMLQSCQSSNGGIIGLRNINDDHSYCKVYSLHAKLNNLEQQNVPNICTNLAVQYVKGGQYSRDLDFTKSVIEDYFNDVKPSVDGLDVILIDIDAIFSLNPHSSNLFLSSISNCIIEAKNLKREFILRLFMNLKSKGWSIILLSRENITHQNVTINHLVSAGFRGWSSLMMSRGEIENYSKENEYFGWQMKVIETKGLRIKSIISSNVDILSVTDTRMRKFLLPDPICDLFEQQRRT